MEPLSQRADERPEYGHRLEFGYFLVPDAGDPAQAVTGRVADGWVSPPMSHKPLREAAHANLAIDRAQPRAPRSCDESVAASRVVWRRARCAGTPTLFVDGVVHLGGLDAAACWRH